MEDIKSIEHFAYPVPFNSELHELELIPYRTNKTLKDKINYLFSHVTFEHRQLFIEVSTMGSRGLINDMSRAAVGVMRYYLLHPQQFGHKIDNIHLQILVRMWKQTFKHCKMQYKQLDKYYSTKMKLLMIENGFIEELIRTCEDVDFIQHNDDMVKPLSERGVVGERIMYDNSWKPCAADIRARKSLGTSEGTANFEYLASLD